MYKRWKEHKSDAFKSYKKVYDSHLYRSIRKYGIENFSFEILKITYDLNKWESFFIFWYNSNNKKLGFNETLGGCFGLWSNFSLERKKEIGEKISKTLSKGTIAKSNWKREYVCTATKQKPFTEEHRKKLSESSKKARKLKPTKAWNRRPVICVETGEIFESVGQANKKYKGHIDECAAGLRKSAGGQTWKYVS